MWIDKLKYLRAFTINVSHLHCYYRVKGGHCYKVIVFHALLSFKCSYIETISRLPIRYSAHNCMSIFSYIKTPTNPVRRRFFDVLSTGNWIATDYLAILKFCFTAFQIKFINSVIHSTLVSRNIILIISTAPPSYSIHQNKLTTHWLLDAVFDSPHISSASQKDLGVLRRSSQSL